MDVVDVINGQRNQQCLLFCLQKDKIEAYKSWFFARRKAATKFGIYGEQFVANASGMHDELLPIRDGAWDVACAVHSRTK